MRFSTLFTKTLRESPKDELSFNARILMQAGFLDKLAAGIYTYLPLGLRVLRRLERIIREEMDAAGGQEILMPALTPKAIWQETGRWENFDALFRFMGVDAREYALGATHEEVVVPLVRQHVFSYRDLPTYVYQIQNKFRNEKRAKSGILRTREFIMKDLYSFHTSIEDLDRYYVAMQKVYFRVFQRCGILEQTYLTYASGGAFSKYSHEFQTTTAAGEDEIYICAACNIAINNEILEDLHRSCPHCHSRDLRPEKAIEVGNIFRLGTRFSEPFGMYFLDEAGAKKPVIMGCYGIGLGRLLGTIAEICHDERGLIWPREIAPASVHLISVPSKDAAVENQIKLASEKLYRELTEENVSTLFDDRSNVSAGAKFADADLIGCPWRIVISERTLADQSAEVKQRTAERGELLPLAGAITAVRT